MQLERAADCSSTCHLVIYSKHFERGTARHYERDNCNRTDTDMPQASARLQPGSGCTL